MPTKHTKGTKKIPNFLIAFFHIFRVFRGHNKIMGEDFYIGYLPKMPKSLAAIIKIFVVLAIAAAIGLAFLSWLGQKPFAKSVFEFGAVKNFEGAIQAKPIPFLLIEKTKKNCITLSVSFRINVFDFISLFFVFPLLNFFEEKSTF